MHPFVHVIAVGMPIWWTALTILFLRDYVRQRKNAKVTPPLTEEERAELAQFETELPRKEWHSPRWYFLHPKEGVRLSGALLLHLPIVFFFLPIAVLIWLLPWDHHRR
ncbi:MAG: hypothetical protein K0R17_852 [Rariglobus sp.]|jgi:hypothetical protein|nr:hypothetical protein [Rariglobus sp.]